MTSMETHGWTYWWISKFWFMSCHHIIICKYIYPTEKVHLSFSRDIFIAYLEDQLKIPHQKPYVDNKHGLYKQKRTFTLRHSVWFELTLIWELILEFAQHEDLPSRNHAFPWNVQLPPAKKLCQCSRHHLDIEGCINCCGKFVKDNNSASSTKYKN